MRVSAAISFASGAVLALAMSSGAYACGESLFRVGKDVAYRAQTAPLPGNVLIVSPDANLAERLAAAGHHVKVVATADQIADALEEKTYDVVLASFNDRELVAIEISGVGRAPTYVPVTTESGQKALAAQAYPRYLSDDDDFTQFLRVIHRTLKASHRT